MADCGEPYTSKSKDQMRCPLTSCRSWDNPTIGRFDARSQERVFRGLGAMAGSTTRNPLTLPQQYLFLRKSKTVAGEGVLGPRRLEWHFHAQPTPLSRTYQVTLVLERDGTPDVRVVDPALRLLAGERDLPHIYHDPDRLCLYLPGTGQWDASKRLDLTIIP